MRSPPALGFCRSRWASRGSAIRCCMLGAHTLVLVGCSSRPAALVAHAAPAVNVRCRLCGGRAATQQRAFAFPLGILALALYPCAEQWARGGSTALPRPLWHRLGLVECDVIGLLDEDHGEERPGLYLPRVHIIKLRRAPGLQCFELLLCHVLHNIEDELDAVRGCQAWRAERSQATIGGGCAVRSPSSSGQRLRGFKMLSHKSTGNRWPSSRQHAIPEVEGLAHRHHALVLSCSVAVPPEHPHVELAPTQWDSRSARRASSTSS